MKLWCLALFALLNVPAYAAEDATPSMQDMTAKWVAAWNGGDATKLVVLYAPDAVWSSGVLGHVTGKADIEKAAAAQMKKTPQIEAHAIHAIRDGNVMWGYGDFAFTNGPSGHYGITYVNDGGTWHISMQLSNVTPRQ